MFEKTELSLRSKIDFTICNKKLNCNGIKKCGLKIFLPNGPNLLTKVFLTSQTKFFF